LRFLLTPDPKFAPTGAITKINYHASHKIYKRKIKKLEKKKRGNVIKFYNNILFAHSSALHETSYGESFKTQRQVQDRIDEMSDEESEEEEEATGEAMGDAAGAGEDVAVEREGKDVDQAAETRVVFPITDGEYWGLRLTLSLTIIL
jgi:hypothetical protein